MKKLFILLFAVLTVHVVHAQGCLPEGITFNTQAQIDSFAINYPGCTEIEGSVLFGRGYPGGSTDITNLNGLNVLTSIGGDLGIGYAGLMWDDANPFLKTLDGLENLQYISGTLQISHNDSLTNLSGLENLASIDGVLHIENNPLLNSLTGLGNIDTASITDIWITGNLLLTECAIKSVCNYLSGSNASHIFDNAPGCNSEEEVEEACLSHCLPEGITFTTQEQIDHFQTDYPGCTEIEGDVTIGKFGDCDIANLNGLSVLTSINGFLEIYGTTQLSDFTGLNNLTSVGKHLGIGKLYVSGNTTIGSGNRITSLNGLDGLTYVGDSIDIRYNVLLGNMDALSNLTLINDDFILSHNTILADFSGCANIDTINGSFIVESMDSLENFSGLENLRIINGSLKISGDFYVHNSKLKNLMGINNLELIGGDLFISGSNALLNLSGLESLSTIGDTVLISYNNSLETLVGLENLSNIGGILYLTHNNVLADISALSNINPASIESISINQNPVLAICDINSICEFLFSTNAYNSINGNAPGCNSLQEVEDACSFFVPDHADNSAILLYPNPATNELYIVCRNGIQLTEVNIYNQLGQKVLQVFGNTQQMDVSMLSKGLYVAELITDKSKFRRKLLLE
jgi:hypothetical protein